MKSKIYSLLVLLTTLFTATQGKAQTVGIKLKDAPLLEIFSELEKQTGVSFNYDASEVNVRRRYDLSYKGSLNGALAQLSNEAGLIFRTEGKRILVRPAVKRFMSGKVTDTETGEGIPGVTVKIANGKVLAITDVTGNYSGILAVAQPARAQLEFRMLGMKTVISPILGNRITFDIALQTDSHNMDEVVITNAYTNGTAKEEVIGSVSQITAKELQVNRPIESIDKMLEGLAAGVYVEPNTTLGTPVKINIRGQGTLTAIGGGRTTSSQPLFVIDGIPIQEQNRGDASAVFNNETLINPIAGINPQDIASISVLKDASATTIYGANAANGVIIITTKSGQEGKTIANVSYNTGVSSFINRMKLLSGPQYYQLKKEALMNDGFTESQAANQSGSPTINTDWLGLTNRNATYHNVNADLSGGKAGLKYRFSTGYPNQQASSIGNSIQQMNMSLRVDNVISKKFKFGITLSPSLMLRDGIDNYANAAYLPPNIAPYDVNGNFSELLLIPNPLAVLAQNTDKSSNLTLNGNANLHYNVTSYLTVSGRIGANFLQGKQMLYSSAKNATGRNAGGNLRIFDRQSLGWLGYVQASFDKTFATRHAVNVLAGYEVQDKTTVLLGGTGMGFSYDRIRELSQAATRSSVSSKQEDATISYYAQANYNLDKKYLFTSSIRADQSSMFGNDKQLALNGAVGLGWIVSKEHFLTDHHAITFLKLKTSYGSTANSRIGTYAARGLYNFSYQNYNGEVAAVPDGSSAANPDLGWETNLKLNVGLDLTLFDKYSINLEYYNNTVHDLISNITVPYESGYTGISANTGKMRNQGLDLTIKTNPIEREHFIWNSVFLMGFNKNKILSFNNGYSSIFADPEGTSGDVNAASKEGYSTSAIWGIRWAGINPQTGLEQFYDPSGNIVDRTTIRTYPSDSWVVLGDKLPKFQGSWINTINYKQMSVTINLLYSYGANFMEPVTYFSDGRNLQNSNMSINLLDRWQQPGDVAEVSKLSIGKGLVRNSSRYLHDLSFIKLSNVTFNYRLPDSVTGKLKMKSMSVFVNATNLGYWYREKSRKDRNGIAEIRFNYPEARTFNLGLNINF
ncbi:hypothetical protein DSL64_22805 [Dyadobacter luteus]|uniref:SusC/RagA family TonB-linked outer membrane protein n=1 Tax=Dyadobacter luteus TaxID=2259619 RepID=A0A3D8Y5E0_9BACT|nr:SusC/RagA family TonB-linked outer membrane protein [Dyadobacter luteus]REA57767.1 hypothetical protein DSL64_22805 [Dyadobacter luteus]